MSGNTSFITAGAAPYSGSHTYIFAKTPGEAASQLNEAYTNYFKAYGQIIEGIDNITESNIATVAAAFNIPQIGNYYYQIMRGMMFEPARQFSQQLHKLYEKLADKAFLNQFVNSPEYARGMNALGRALPPDSVVNDQLNYQFFTHNRVSDNEELNGSLNAIDADTLQDYFQVGSDSAEWPNLILTSNHALVKDHHDVSGIMKGIHALVRDLFNGHHDEDAHRLHLLERTDHSKRKQPQSKPSIMISSVFNDHNAWVNGGTLLLRLYELDMLYDKEQQWLAEGGQDNAERRRWREKAYLGKGDTAMSPASIRLAKLMLKLIVEEPDRVDIPGREAFEKDWKDDLSQSYNSEPLTLRQDAREILQHIKLVGYSKGGNIVSDALRYLSLELQRDQGEHKLIQVRDDAKQTHDITQEEVKALLMNTGVLSLNPGISPLTDYEKQSGIRRLSVRNPKDWVTAHLFARHHLTQHDGTNDDIYEVHPNEAPNNMGHDPEQALGNMDIGLRGYLTDRDKMQSDEAHFDEMKSRLKCFLASCHGKSGIKSLREEGDSLKLEFSAGASKADTANVIKHLQKALLPTLASSGRSLIIDHDWSQSCELTIHAPLKDDTVQVSEQDKAPRMEQLKKAVGEALLQLEDDKETFVGHNVYRDLGVNPPVNGKAKA